MKYTAPPASLIGSGKDFDALPVENGFLSARSVLNGTVGCYHRFHGKNIKNDRVSVGADSVQPGALCEVFRTEVIVTGPESYAPCEPKATDKVPWGPYSKYFYPGGASISFYASSTGQALISYEVGLEKSNSAHVLAQTGYAFHEISCRSELKYRKGTPSSPPVATASVAGSVCRRKAHMEGATTADSHQATSLSGQGLVDVTEGEFVSVWVEISLTPNINGTPSSAAMFMQLVGPGSSITATLIKR